MRRKKIRKIFPDKKSFSDRISELVKDLWYISETDSEIFPFVGEQTDEVTAEKLLDQLDRRGPVEERDFETFFSRLTEIQEWFGDEETRAANRFSELKAFLEKNLRQIKVFKIGQIEIDIYTVGLDENNNLKGVWTRAVET